MPGDTMSQPSNNDQLAHEMPKRLLGKTGEKLSIIGLGGIVVMNAEPEHAKTVVAEAVEGGVSQSREVLPWSTSPET